MECCICKKEFDGYGNNPYPLVDDPDARCCDACNTQVVYARIFLARGRIARGNGCEEVDG